MSSNGDERSGNDRPANGEPSVLANLPSTRPQRPSTRRAAARRTTKARAERPAGNGAKPIAGKAPAGRVAKAAAPAAKAGGQRAASAKRTAKAARAPAAKPPGPGEPLAPPQGFDAEGGIEPGVSVQAPSGGELAASLVELAEELARSGLSSGGRLLKSAFARLPGL